MPPWTGCAWTPPAAIEEMLREFALTIGFEARGRTAVVRKNSPTKIHRSGPAVLNGFLLFASKRSIVRIGEILT